MREELIQEAGKLLVAAAERLRTTKAKTVDELKYELAQVAGDVESAGQALKDAVGKS